MPNQYTKFKAAIENGQPYEFRFKKCLGPKPRKKNVRSKTSTGRSTTSMPTSVLIYTPSNGFRIDPFRSYPVKPNQEELSVLDHFLYHLAPSANQNALLFGKQRSLDTDPHIKYLLPYVLHEAPLFDALLATCQAQIMLSAGASAYSDEFFVFHRGRAMAGLRKQLENEANTSAMLAVTMLITCDYLTGDVNAVAGHARALERMLHMRGEMPRATKWDDFVFRGVQVYKTISHVATGRQAKEGCPRTQLDTLIDPLISLEYPQPPFSTQMCRTWSNLPQGFSDLILSSSLSTQLIHLITAVHQIDPELGKQLNETLIKTAPIQAALQRFLQHTDATTIERIIASGLLIYTFQYPRQISPNLFHDPPMRGITKLLADPHGIQAGYERDALVWTHAVVEGFAFYRSARLPGSREVYVRAVSKYPLMQDWPKLEVLLKEFFYTPELLVRWKICNTDCLSKCPENRIEDSKSSPTILSIPYEQQNALKTSPKCPFSGQNPQTQGSSCPFSQLAVNQV